MSTESGTKHLDDMIVVAETEGVPYQSGDVYRPVHDSGESDLNLHMLDMLAEPDPSQDPYAGGQA